MCHTFKGSHLQTALDIGQNLLNKPATGSEGHAMWAITN